MKVDTLCIDGDKLESIPEKPMNGEWQFLTYHNELQRVTETCALNSVFIPSDRRIIICKANSSHPHFASHEIQHMDVFNDLVKSRFRIVFSTVIVDVHRILGTHHSTKQVFNKLLFYPTLYYVMTNSLGEGRNWRGEERREGKIVHN